MLKTNKSRKAQRKTKTSTSPSPTIRKQQVRTVAAYHLAGFVAAMHMYGWKPESVTCTEKSFGIVFPYFLGIDATSHQDALNQCMCFCAGKIAVNEVIKRRKFWDLDSTLHRRILSEMDEDYASNLYYARKHPDMFRWRKAPLTYIIEKRAKQAFSDNWDLIEIITGALLDRGTLTGPECQELLA